MLVSKPNAVLCLIIMMIALLAGFNLATGGVDGGTTSEQQQLWDMTASRATLMDAQIYSTSEVDGCWVQHVFFTSEVGPNGPNRVYMAVAWPKTLTGPFPAMMILHGGGGIGTTDTALAYAKGLGVYAMAVDWGGKLPNDPNIFRTVWRAPSFDDQTLLGLTSAQHRTIVAFRRAFDYAATLPTIVNMNKVIVTGGSWGGYYTSLLAGIDPRVTDAIPLTGIGGWRDSHSKLAEGVARMAPADRETWFRTLDPIAYSTNTTADLTLVAHANDTFFWLDGVMKNFEKLAGPKRVVITPNSDHGVGTYQDPISPYPYVESIMQHHLQGTAFPQVTSGSLQEQFHGVFTWQTTGPAVSQATLYFSPGNANRNPRSAYWIEIPAQFVGTSWKATLPDYLFNVAGQYYVTVFASDNRVASSLVRTRPGLNPQTTAVPLWPGDTLWDYAAGNYAWRTSVDFRFTGLQPLLDSNGVRIMPDDPATPHFEVRTDSTVLLGARAAEFAGIKVRIDGEGIPGSLMIQLQDDDHTRFNPVGYNATMNYTAEQSETFIPWSSFIGPSGARIQAFPFESLVTSGTRSTPLTIQSIEPYIAPPFLDGLKNGAPRLGSSYFTWAGTGVNMAVNVGTELLEIASSNAANGTSYAIEYPKSGTILWNTSQNRYLQAWLPYVGGGDVASIQFSVDGGAFGGDVWANRIDGLITANGPNARPALIDVNALAGLSSGTHQLRFRFVFFNTNYSATADLNKLEATMDWVQVGSAPQVQTNVGACTFSGPTDGAVTPNNPPTLQWSGPTGAQYIVSYSQDPYFRGPSTVTVHDVSTTNYTPPALLATGTWYWTVMAVNNDGIAGNALYKGFSAPNQAEAKNYIFYSFQIVSGEAPIFQDFKDGGPNFGTGYFTWAGDSVSVVSTTNTQLLEITSSNAANGTSYAIEYPKWGSIAWNTSQNRYLQAWLPYVGGGDVASIQFSVDRGAFGGDVWANRIDGLITANGPNARPALIDVNALAGLSSGIQQGTGAHQLRFRFVFFNTNYSATADLNKLEATMDWVRAGMAPSVQTSVGTCGFVGPADNTSTSNPPTLQWSAPAGFGSGSYIVSYSKDPYFRGPSTVTLHNVTTTNYTPPSALAQGKWYWTVMAVNSGRVTGNALYKAFSAPDQAEAKNYIFYSFNIMP